MYQDFCKKNKTIVLQRIQYVVIFICDNFACDWQAFIIWYVSESLIGRQKPEILVLVVNLK